MFGFIFPWSEYWLIISVPYKVNLQYHGQESFALLPVFHTLTSVPSEFLNRLINRKIMKDTLMDSLPRGFTIERKPLKGKPIILFAQFRAFASSSWYAITASENVNTHTDVVRRYPCIYAKGPAMDGEAISHSSFSSCLVGDWKVVDVRGTFLPLIHIWKDAIVVYSRWRDNY